ncbi:oligosaccharide flippase family protein [Niabella drilacis]|uniref:Membrane protein involved in the export of O-antigen and teichoic acid n=1 Tax=Niabella drilacis (strain DSM 25811 / CCM 8410 / CCUG 62505 / LMG 26954 / E90) TaxID=1285928 RepID=A0A1G6IUV6_NIADE|nr:lipopolysaccharide biosynthesis protein [Niabella drilacis]SDC10200.1 Membrane protein involved in the export of O-antigen and teichoic acid [Niabella drilacis]
MSAEIRKHSIISSAVIYIGFAVGALNTYLFGREGFFTEEQYGLTQLFNSTTLVIVSFASLGMPSFIYKFYHYYNDNLEPRKNDMIAWSLLTGLAGFVIVFVLGVVFEQFFARKFSNGSALAVYYYYWMYPMSLGLTIFGILEAYGWSLKKSVLTNFLKEVQWRLLTTVLIILFILKVIPDFGLFIKLYSFIYPLIALMLLFYLVATKKIHLTFRISKVTRRFFKKLLRFIFFVYSGLLVFTISQQFDSLVLASVTDKGLKNLSIFTLAQFLTSLIQAPQRSIIAASIPYISKAWKEKKINQIQNIYQRSSINQLIFASLLFTLIALNYTDAIVTLKLRQSFLLGFVPFILLGLTRVIDMGTGVNSQIIGTSTYWKFDLVSGIILLLFMLPLTYIFTKKYGLMGPPVANLISTTIYNIVRIIFLWKKFRLFPFTRQTLYTLILGAVVYLAAWLLFRNLHGFPGLFARSIFILVLFTGGIYFMNLTPDLKPVLASLTKRLKKDRN